MEQEIFRAGVRPGAPASNDEIKILVCYILSKTGAAMSFAQIHEALLEHELVNYFELVTAVDALERTGHIKNEAGDPKAAVYRITELGENTGVVNSFLSASVRDKAVHSAKNLLRRKKREKEVSVEIVPSGMGFDVKLALPGDGLNLASFSVFCPTKDEADLVRRRFLNDPVYIYKGVMALLTGDRNVIGEMFPEREDLF